MRLEKAHKKESKDFLSKEGTKERNKKNGKKAIFEEIVTEDFPKLIKILVLQLRKRTDPIF